MKEEKDDIKMEVVTGAEASAEAGTQQDEAEQETAKKARKETAEAPQKEVSVLDQLKKQVSEDDSTPVGTLTLRQILGGDILSAQMVRSQIWLLLLIVLFIVVGVAFRYQCQQDTITISQLEDRLVDAKYRALSASSKLTEQCRESRVFDALKANQNSDLKTSNQPPYIINVE